MECGSDPTKREGERTDCSHTVVASGGEGGCVVDHDVVCVCMDTVVNGTWQLAVHSRTFLGSPVTTTS